MHRSTALRANELQCKSRAVGEHTKCRCQLMDFEENRTKVDGITEGCADSEGQQQATPASVTAGARPEVLPSEDAAQLEPEGHVGARHDRCLHHGASTPPLQLLTPPLSRLAAARNNSVRRLRRQAARLRHSVELTNRRSRRNRSGRHEATSAASISGEETNATNITSTTGIGLPNISTSISRATPTTTSLRSLITPSNSAVRVLFRQHLPGHLYSQQQTIPGASDSLTSNNSGNAINQSVVSSGASGDSIIAPAATHPINYNHHLNQQRQRQAAIVEASRRLIERQIETLQDADSRRWNFDFRNCRPMNQPDHRFYGHRVQRCARLNRSNSLGDDTDRSISSANRRLCDPEPDLANSQSDSQGDDGSNGTSENDNTTDSERRQLQATGARSVGGPTKSRNFKPLNDQN